MSGSRGLCAWLQGNQHTACAQKEAPCLHLVAWAALKGMFLGSAVPKFPSGQPGDRFLWIQKTLVSVRENPVGPLYSHTIYKLYPLVAIRLNKDHTAHCSCGFLGFFVNWKQELNQISVCRFALWKFWAQLLLMGLVLFWYQSEQCSVQQYLLVRF